MEYNVTQHVRMEDAPCCFKAAKLVIVDLRLAVP